MAFSKPPSPALYKSSPSTWGGRVIARRPTTFLTSGRYFCTNSSSVTLPGFTRRLLGQSSLIFGARLSRRAEVLAGQPRAWVIIGASGLSGWDTQACLLRGQPLPCWESVPLGAASKERGPPPPPLDALRNRQGHDCFAGSNSS